MTDIPDSVCVGMFIVLFVALFAFISGGNRRRGYGWGGDEVTMSGKNTDVQGLSAPVHSREWHRENATRIQKMRHLGPGREGFESMDNLFKKTLNDYKERGELREAFGKLYDDE